MTQSPTEYVTQIRKQGEEEECVCLCTFHFRRPNVKIVKRGCTWNVCVTEAGHLEERQSREEVAGCQGFFPSSLARKASAKTTKKALGGAQKQLIFTL